MTKYRDYLKDFVESYTNGNAGKIPIPSLLDEMQVYSEKQSEALTGQKAHRLYVKALWAGKTPLAQRIKNKYGHLFPKPDDASIALGFALITASKHE